MSPRPRLIAAIVLVAALYAPGPPALGAGWAPGERLPSLIVAEVNRRIAGSLRARQLSWHVPNTIEAHEVAILDPDGKTVAVAAHLEASLEVKALAQRTLRVTQATVRGLKLNLLQDARGLNIARAFAARGVEASEDAPLKILIDRVTTSAADVLYRRDKLAVAIAGLAVSAAVSAEGKRYRVVTPVEAERVAIQIDQVKLSVDRVEGARVIVDQDGLDATGVRFQIAQAESTVGGRIRWGERRRFALTGQLALPAGYWPDGIERPDLRSGALRAAVSLRGPLDLPQIRLEIEPTTLEVAGQALREVSGVLVIDREQALAEALRGRYAGGRFEGSGRYGFERRALEAQAELSGLGLAQLARRDDLKGTLGGRLRVKGRLAEPWRLDLDFDGSSRRLEALGATVEPAHALKATARLDAAQLQIDQASLRGPVLALTASGPVRLKPRELELEVDAAVKDPAALHARLEGVQGEGLRLRGRVEGPFDEVRFQGELRGERLRYKTAAVEALRARLTADAHAVELDAVRGRVAGGALQAALRLQLDGAKPLRGRAQLTAASVAPLVGSSPEQLDGTVDASAALGDTLDSPQARVEVRVPALRAQGAGPFELAAALLWQGGALTLSRLAASGSDGAPLLEGEGRLVLEEGAIEGALQLLPTNIASLPYAADGQLAGSIQGSARVTGTLELPVVDAQLQLERVAMAGEPLGDGVATACVRGDMLRASFTISSDQAPPMTACEEPALPETARLSGWVRYQRTHRFLDARLRLRQFDLSPLAAQVPELAGMQGSARADVRVRGPLDQLEGRASARVDGVAVHAQQIGTIQISADMAHGLTNLTLDAWGQVSGGGVFDLREGRRRLEAFLTMSALEPELLSATLRQRGARGAVNGQLHLVYDRAQETALVIEADLQRGLLNLPPAEPIRLLRPTQVRLAGEHVTLAETVLESGGSRVTARGTLDGDALDVSLRGELALPLLRLMTPEITAAEGLCGVELAITGTRSRPQLRGEISPRPGASLTPRAVGRPVEFAEGRLLFSEQQVRAERLHALGLGGEVWLDGSVELEEGAIARYDLSGRAENLLLRVPRVRAEVNADLALRGAAHETALTGTVEVVEGRFFERYQLRNFTATAASSATSRSLAELVPQLAATSLDVRLTGTDLRAHADMGSVVVQLTGNTNLRVGGSLRDISLTGVVDVTEGWVQVLESRLDVETATVDFPPRPDRRVIPNIDLLARKLLEPQESPTGAELPVLLTLAGDIEQMQLDVEAEESGYQISRVDLLTVIATGRSAQALLGETSGDAALRLVSREVFSDSERRVEGILDQLARSFGGRDIDLTLVEVGTSGARTGLSWDLSRRLQVEAETSIALVDEEAVGADGERVTSGTVRTALRARYLLADNLPVVDSVALQADWTDLSFAEDVYSTLDLKLKMRILER